MKFIKYFFLFLIAGIAIFLLIAFFSKKDYSVTREVIINQPKEEVFEYLKLLKNQEHFNVWAKMDPNMKRIYTGQDGTVGFVSRWESNNEEVGTGEQEIKGISEGERIDYELRFIKPFESVSSAYISTDMISENQTRVAWSFNGVMHVPFNLLLLFMDFEKQIGNDLQQGLNNLKEIQEKQKS